MTALPATDWSKRENMRRAAAYHEAGHAVAVVHFGWTLRTVEIDERWFTGFRGRDPYRCPNAARDRVIIDLAGWPAECRLHGTALRSDEDLLTSLESVRFDEDEEDYEGDDESAFRLMLFWREQNGLPCGDDLCLAWYREQEVEVAAILDLCWPAVVALAEALIQRGDLTGSEATAVIEALA